LVKDLIRFTPVSVWKVPKSTLLSKLEEKFIEGKFCGNGDCDVRKRLKGTDNSVGKISRKVGLLFLPLHITVTEAVLLLGDTSRVSSSAENITAGEKVEFKEVK